VRDVLIIDEKKTGELRSSNGERGARSSGDQYNARHGPKAAGSAWPYGLAACSYSTLLAVAYVGICIIVEMRTVNGCTPSFGVGLVAVID